VKPSLSLGVSALLTDGSVIADQANDGPSISFSDGTGAKKCNQQYHALGTLAQSATDSLDLSGTSLKDGHNRNVALARVQVIKIRNNSTTNSLVIGGNANALMIFANANDKLILPPLAEILMVCQSAAGWVVTAGTGDILDITHGGEDATASTYYIEIAGSLT
jgi:hypothetical protein